MKVFSLVLVEVVALAVAAQPRPLVAAPRQNQEYQQYSQDGTDGPDLRAAEEQIFALGNQARAQAGVASLAWDPALAAAALQHCRMMAAAGPISHQYRGELDLGSRAAQAGAHFGVIEENVAVAHSAVAVHQAWMQSPGHRQNLLSPEVDRVGIALVYAHGVLYAVADYSAGIENLSPAQVETRVAVLVRASGVSILDDPAMARAACTSDDNLRRSRGAPPAWMIRWQNTDLSHLPQDLVKQLASGNYRKAAIGSCPAQGDGSGFTAYRVAVLLY
ncbi:MAG: CAP domain-containing protein [Terracidiphilus sp.]